MRLLANPRLSAQEAAESAGDQYWRPQTHNDTNLASTCVALVRAREVINRESDVIMPTGGGTRPGSLRGTRVAAAVTSTGDAFYHGFCLCEWENAELQRQR